MEKDIMLSKASLDEIDIELQKRRKGRLEERLVRGVGYFLLEELTNRMKERIQNSKEQGLQLEEIREYVEILGKLTPTLMGIF